MKKSDKSADNTEKSQLQDDEEELERPDWDDEQWRSQASADDDYERPEWDEEKWRSKTETDEAVDDIVKTEADEALKSEDEKLAKAFTANSIKDKLKGWVQAWWDNPKARYSSIGGFAALLVVLMALPAPRYSVLNTFGVRGSVEVVVLDEQTQLPLKNVQVILANKQATTDIAGTVQFDSIRLGRQTMRIEKSAYDTYQQDVTISMGNNSFEPISLQAIGSQFNLSIIDWLSKEAITTAEAIFENNSAITNDNGEILLTVPPTDAETFTISVIADGYLEQFVDIDPLSTDLVEVSLVIKKPHYYVSQRDGRYDIYKSDANGDRETLIVKGTGKENQSIRFSISPNGERAVLVSTRDGLRNEDGFLLSGLFLVDLPNAALTKIDQSERLDIAGWIDDSLLYVKVQEGASGRNPERSRLVSLNSTTNQVTEIRAANYFNAVTVAQDFVFYAPSDAYKENPKPGLFKNSASGNAEIKVTESTVWSLIRDSFNSVVYDAQQEWFTTPVAPIQVSPLSGPPSNRTSRVYTRSPYSNDALWVDQRDGKGVLIAYDIDSDSEEVLTRQSGLRNPVQWLDKDHVVYRVVTSSETADYILSIASGDTQKITDVSDVSGVGRYFYNY